MGDGGGLRLEWEVEICCCLALTWGLASTGGLKLGVGEVSEDWLVSIVREFTHQEVFGSECKHQTKEMGPKAHSHYPRRALTAME